ncbi:MAG: DEAD/DEAH box helicase [Treponema sp.]|jgi:superfamily II DNA or RNA helicase|nr:DEAD/DEAH box helicase [Treponema sp.]
MAEVEFSPGALVRARGREWVVEPSDYPGCLRLRPLGGSDDVIQIIQPKLETEKVVSANFDLPDPERPGNYHSALLLRDALRMKLRSGAGPFRSFGHIAVEPRSYQLVPLLMALKQKTVRLLVADDVGIGKTIEGCLIIRELLARGEIRRFAVLCPPHLVEQWQTELDTHFHIKAAGLTSSSVNRLERDVPRGVPFFEHYKTVVISLDYIKQDGHRNAFIREAPELILVDEAHTCTVAGKGRQLRYQMLKELSADENRHLVFLTATPHSGKDEAFYNLLSLLRNDFIRLADNIAGEDKADFSPKNLRDELGNYFVQRRRIDIEEWHEGSVFPKRMVKEITYVLKNEWGTFFEDVRDYCYNLAKKAEEEKGEEASRLMWYATLALLRCASSSPAAAFRALSNRLSGMQIDADIFMDEHIGDGEELDLNDQEPPALLDAELTEEGKTLKALTKKADELRGNKKDPKLQTLVSHITDLLLEKPKPFRPVVFCRYIATAFYVADELRNLLQERFPLLEIYAVTGLLSPEEREEKVAALLDAPMPILVATDCLSEGINLQHGFNAVIHYDLAWNPTRHEQREGRVDRYGQDSREVRCTMLYGQNNPVDGFILNVILKRAHQIKKDLGFMVPLPEDNSRIQQALIKAALMKSKTVHQGTLDFGDDPLSAIESEWRDAQEKAKINRTIFSQRRIHPEEVMPEWNKQAKAIGSQETVQQFMDTALSYLGSPLVKNNDDTFTFDPTHLINNGISAKSLQERLENENCGKKRKIGFSSAHGAYFIHRSHPIVTVLADYILEQALEKSSGAVSAGLAGRAAVFETEAVKKVTTLYLIRLRHQLDYKRDADLKKLLAEEALVLGFQGSNATELLEEDTSLDALMNAHPSANLSNEVMTSQLKTAIEWFLSHKLLFEEKARQRAGLLLEDHQRVRSAARAKGQYAVIPCLPVDLIGVYVLLPAEL